MISPCLHRYLLPVLLLTGISDITPAWAECSVQLSDSTVDYGLLTRGELLTRSGNNISSPWLFLDSDQTLELTISCESAVPVGLRFMAPTGDSESYLFGPAGTVSLTVSDAQVDNLPVSLTDSVGNRRAEPKMDLTPGSRLTFWRDNAPVRGTQFRVRVSMAVLLPTNMTQVKDRRTWQLNGYFSVDEM